MKNQRQRLLVAEQIRKGLEEAIRHLRGTGIIVQQVRNTLKIIHHRDTEITEQKDRDRQ